MELNEAIIHARQVAEGCGVDSRDCAYQHDKLSDWLEELQDYRATGLTPDELAEAAALLQAKREGRCVVVPPPAKEGEAKPKCFFSEGSGPWCLGFANEGDDEPIDLCKKCWYCEGGDFAEERTEAEAALGEHGRPPEGGEG